ncbi:isocitrate lyase/PEP mutase family protein [Bordetella genomosp. 8]|uniref:isocitrate lyase/PEP mutase family protein n=1 Tax=Bordetella genomosp. 8 TaxID=1416806 RepID=UPI000A32680F|nr:isocitrate lyase/PEP mutase family protein [Bordetella genomosp. 8]
MKASLLRQRLKGLLAGPSIVAAPGAFDALSARQVQQAGFPAVYLGSYAVCATLGLPDVGLLDLTTLAARLRSVCAAVDVPVIADAENGFFDAAGIRHAIQVLEGTGVSAIHIEDHVSGKHTDRPRRILSTPEMVAKIEAALDARTDPDFQIIARTDAMWANGDLDDAVARMRDYGEAGADAVMPSHMGAATLKGVRERLAGKVVLVHRPPASVMDEEEAGANLVVYHDLCLHAAYTSVGQALEAFADRKHLPAASQPGSNPGSHPMSAPLDGLLGYDAHNARAARYGLPRS